MIRNNNVENENLQQLLDLTLEGFIMQKNNYDQKNQDGYSANIDANATSPHMKPSVLSHFAHTVFKELKNSVKIMAEKNKTAYMKQ